MNKPNAENNIRVLETWILAVLRNLKFFTFNELNKTIRKKLEKFSAKPFQKKKGSQLYETAVWSTNTTQPDYLITTGNCKYSVPYKFIGK